MKLEINLASRFYVNFQKVNFFIMLAAVTLVIWISASIYFIAANHAELGKFSADKSRLISKAGKDQVAESDYNKMLAEVKFVNSFLTRRSVNWLTLFDHLEMLVPDGVALRGIEPGLKNENLKLSGSARNFTTLRKFMENLEGSKNFTEIFLTEHANVKVGVSQKGINFSITCKANI